MVYQETLSQLLGNSEKVSAVLSSLIEKNTTSHELNFSHPWIKRIPYTHEFSPRPLAMEHFDESYLAEMAGCECEEIYYDDNLSEDHTILRGFVDWIVKNIPILKDCSDDRKLVLDVTTPDSSVELCNDRWEKIEIRIVNFCLYRDFINDAMNYESYETEDEIFSGIDTVFLSRFLLSNFYSCYNPLSYRVATKTTTHLGECEYGTEEILAKEIIYRKGKLVGLPHVER